MIFTGRYHGEPATIAVRAAETEPARQRFARCVEVHTAFGPNPPSVVAGAYRWSDHDRSLVLRDEPATMLATHPNQVVRPALGLSREIVAAAAARLSAWPPAEPDTRAWHVDYESMIGTHHHTGALTDDDADRLRDLIERCGPIRTFAHGDLTPHRVKRLPSGRIVLTGFHRAGMYLPARDLATLYLTLPHDDHAADQVVMRRVIDVDVLEPFAVNLMLAVADALAARSGRTVDPASSLGRTRWPVLWRARLLAHHLLRRLTTAA
jgi:hypothetical protein